MTLVGGATAALGSVLDRALRGAHASAARNERALAGERLEEAPAQFFERASLTVAHFPSVFIAQRKHAFGHDYAVNDSVPRGDERTGRLSQTRANFAGA